MMNTKLIIVFLLFISIALNAQGRRKNESSIHAEYGYMNSSDSLKKGGYMAKIGYMRVIGDKGFLGKAEGFYQDYKVNYIDGQVLPYKRYGLNVSAGYSYEGLYPVFLNGWFGAYGAYETANDGNTKDPRYNAEIPTNVKGFVYGLSGSAEAEIVLVRKLSLLVNYTQYYDLKSKFSKSNYAFFGGIRYYIN
ncbi:hypothetical protein C1631_022845 [Chryseobacterium phosphatilyticum]|uniref:Conjugal transfer protein TraO n=1 Tax=Chryseobacterium phosphatilyticum TaxID=475075 RepID=A0A316WPI6_9FLAO|nr:hypothetical protein [Chryseobacterium phosphatilyticum]PWN62406.1 hypothetical protein C1631_022845 [Chryseobacterium phosphatilyticum]